MNLEVQIQIDEPFVDAVDRVLIENVVETTVATSHQYDLFELGIVITDDENIHRINKEYRGIDEPTDVISFALLEGEDDFVMPPDNKSHLGEVVISYPRAVHQAHDQKHPIEHELAWLVIHGVLHLLGHDHQTETDRQAMHAIERKILKQIDIK